MFIEKNWLLQRSYIKKVSGGCAKLVLIGHRSPTWQLNWSKIVLLACQLQERGNDFFTLSLDSEEHLHMQCPYVVSATLNSKALTTRNCLKYGRMNLWHPPAVQDRGNVILIQTSTYTCDGIMYSGLNSSGSHTQKFLVHYA